MHVEFAEGRFAANAAEASAGAGAGMLPQQPSRCYYRGNNNAITRRYRSAARRTESRRW